MSRWNWNLEKSVFAEGGKRENPEKHLQSKVQESNRGGRRALTSTALTLHCAP